MKYIILALLILITSCSKATTPPLDARRSTVSVVNGSGRPTIVYVAFGANSKVVTWPICSTFPGGVCGFRMDTGATVALPLGGAYLNATLAFDTMPGCNSTKIELNVNNPKWYDIVDISLVDGWNRNVIVTAGGKVLGPVLSGAGNEKGYGVFPYGCDLCTERQQPPCGIQPGGPGCKAGTQYKPDVPCQYQGSALGGGTVITVKLLP